MTDVETLNLLLPEIVLLTAATLIYLGGAFFPKRFLPNLAAVAALVIAIGVLGWQTAHEHAWIFSHTPAPRISGPLAVDVFGLTCRWGVLVFGLLLALTATNSPSVRPAAEYAGSLLLIVAGLMLVAAAYDLALLFLGLELVSIPTYVVLYVGRRGALGQEATAKYFFLSILSSALLLYGFSFLYGAAGATRLDALVLQLRTAIPAVAPGVKLASVGLLLVFAGLGFKMTAVPFHFYAPDVYQGTSNLNAGLLSTLPKIAALVVLVRLVFASLPGLEDLGWRLAMVLAVLTMTLGNVLALWQDNIRRLLAYSSIAHGGYMLIGLSVGLAGLAHAEHLRVKAPPSDLMPAGVPLEGVGTLLFYLAVYCLATIGAFAALKYLSSADRQLDGVDELAGLGRTRPLAALALAVSMFSLAGVPPLAGFWGKLELITGALGVNASQHAGDSALRWWFIGLAIVAMVNAAIAMAYYLRVVAAMYLRPPLTTPKAEGGRGAAWAMALCALLVLAAGVYPGPLVEATNRAASTLREFSPQEIKGAAADVPSGQRLAGNERK